MWQIVKFEISKLLNKKIVWAAGAGMAIMLFLMTQNWIAPGTHWVQYFEGDSFKHVEGLAGVQMNKDIAAEFEGELTTPKVQAILEKYRWPSDKLAAQGLEQEKQKHYYHNELYGSLASNFANGDGSYNGASVEGVYGSLARDLKLGYSAGWESTIYGIVYTILIWGCVLVIILAPLFSDEYSRGMDALILTGTYGRNKCGTAKILAAFIVSGGLTAIMLGIQLAAFFLTNGLAGKDASMQLAPLGVFEIVPYPLSSLQALLFGCLVCFTGCMVIAAVTILFSSIARNSFVSLIIGFSLYAVPMFIQWKDIPVLNVVGQFFPINQIQMWSLAGFDKLHIAGADINIMWATLPVAVILSALAFFLSRRVFSNHQVVGN